MAVEYYFDETAASRAVDFFSLCLKHVEGEWAGTPFVLQPWQANEIVRPLFGWKKTEEDGTQRPETDLRRFRQAYIEIPRKNGKSALSSGIALYLLHCDKEPGAQVYSAAADRQQASIVFGVAKKMVQEGEHLAPKTKCWKHFLEVPSSHSIYRVLSADAAVNHGLNSHGILFDELHTQSDRELWDTLTTSCGARRQPLIVSITTAGDDRNSVCFQMHDYAEKVRDGVINDPEFLAVIYAADPDDDWTSPEVWKKANPNFGISVKEDFLRSECKQAQEMPSKENAFRRLYLNQWTTTDRKWLSIEKWKACAGNIDLEELKGRECYGGLDLSNNIDISAFCLLFPFARETFKALWWFWVPSERIMDRVKKDRVPYDVWTHQKFIEQTDGNVIDYEYIGNKIDVLSKIYKIKEIGADPWNATQFIQQLEKKGHRVIAVNQNFGNLSSATKQLEGMILGRKLEHGGNPVATWMASNVAIKSDANGNIRPAKDRSREKIDGISALVNALSRAAFHVPKVSVYKTRGIATI